MSGHRSSAGWSQAFAFVAALTLLTAETATGQVAQGDMPSVDKLIQLHQQGIPENVLVAWIKQANSPIRLTTDDLLKLTNAKVPERAVQALMDPTVSAQPSASTPPPGAVTPTVVIGLNGVPVGAVPVSTRTTGATTDERTAAGDPNDPLAAHDSGIYLHRTLPEVEMILLEPTAYTGANTSSFWHSVTPLVAKSTKASIPGKEASIRANDKRPTFYFYFEDRAAALGRASFFGGISSPNQFVLVKLDSKRTTRETTIGRESVFGASSGTSSKAAVAFRADRLKAGLYKVTFEEDLKPGEYAFMVSSGIAGAQQAGAASPVQIFDFGVDLLK